MPRVTEGKSEGLEMPAPCPDQTAALSPAGASEHLPHLLPQEEEEALWSVGEANTAIHRGGVSHARSQEAHRGVDAVQRENGHFPSGRWGNAEVGVPRGSHGYPREGQKGCLPGCPGNHVLGSQHGLCQLPHQLSVWTQECRTLRVQSKLTGGLWGRESQWEGTTWGGLTDVLSF